MDWADTTLLRLADPATRTALFDATALEQFVNATYDTAAMPVEGPYQAVFDEVQLGVPVSSLGIVDGSWQMVGSTEKTEAHFILSGLGPPLLTRVDAVWRGGIVARITPATGRI